MSDFDTHESSVLVIGSGGAGLQAAIEAGKTATVNLISKGPVGRSGATILSGADIMADGRTLHELGFAGDPADNPEKWAEDITVEGFYLNEPDLVEVYVKEAGHRIEDLLNWGLKVKSSGDREIITTGMSISSSLREGLKEVGSNVKKFDGIIAIDLIKDEDGVVGLIGLNVETGKINIFRAKSVVIATGGWHRAYSFNAGADELTGDGQSMAYRAGAELIDMEMVTFCPNIMLHPPRHRGSLLFYVLPGNLVNSRGDAIMNWENPNVKKLSDTTEWNKLLLSKASAREVMEGRGSPNNGVYFSMKHMPTNLFEAQQKMLPDWKFQGDDFSGIMEKMDKGYAAEVGPAAEYFEGGIRINSKCETSIPGLYAAGECTGGLFGANRVAAATTEMVVQGAVAGRNAAKKATESTSLRQIPDQESKMLANGINKLLTGGSGNRPGSIRKQLGELAYEKVGVIRTAEGLSSALTEIQDLKEALSKAELQCKRREKNLELARTIELRNLLTCVELSARSALAREESRGVHIRDDFPKTDNEKWLVHLIHEIDGKSEGPDQFEAAYDRGKLEPELDYDAAIVSAAEKILQ